MTLTQSEAWIYCRRSRASQDQASVADQEERGREACAEHGWRVAGVLSEEVSASKYARKDRGDWPVLLDKIRAGLVGILILWQSSRGDRKLGEWATFLDLCAEQGTRLHILADERTYNLANKADWKQLASQGVDNDYFSRNLSVEIARGKSKAMRKGRQQGAPPYGYEVRYNTVTGKTAGWSIIKDEARVVAEIIEHIGKSVPVQHIETDLNARRVAGPNGGQWTTSSIRHIARNPSYAGLTQLPDGSYVARQPQADGAEWPAIVTREQWEAAKSVLESRQTGPRPGGVKHLMSNMCNCECGLFMRSNGQGAYVCQTGHNYVKEEWLDAVIRYFVCRRLSRPEARELFTGQDEPDKAVIRSELKELTDRRSGFRKKAALGKITEDALEEIEAELNPEIERRERRLQGTVIVPAVAELVAAGDSIEATFRVWDGLELQARRAAIAAVTGVVVRRVPKTATKAERYPDDPTQRLKLDGKPQPPKRGPGGRLRAAERG